MTPQEELIIAREIAEKAFFNKKDRGGAPYIDHLIYVQTRVSGFQQMTVAILHDLIEDCPEWDYSRLFKIGFSTDTIHAINAITKRPNERYNDYLERVNANDIARAVKIVDLEHNMQIQRLNEITDKDIERLKKYHKAYKFLTK